MIVKILNIERQINASEYEISMQVGDVKCACKLNLQRANRPYIWGFDSKFHDCLKDAPLAPKHVVKIVGAFHDGDEVKFPAYIGDF